MAISLGTENKRQVRIAAGLGIAILAIGAYEIYGLLRTPSTTTTIKPISVPTLHATNQVRKSSRSRLDPVLRIDELTRSEQVEYAGTGRDVFAPMPEPVVVETPLASARANDIAASLPPIEPLKPPSMDLKYLGYTQTNDKTFTATFTHGDDIFMAKTGDIMFHRFRVGVIQPTSVQVTDLSHNFTQNIAVAAAAN